MKYKKYAIAVLVMAIIYLAISYLFSLLFGREYHWPTRVISAIGFGIIIMIIQVVLSRKKRK